MATRKLVVEVIGDTSSVEKALGKTGKEADQLGTRMGGLGKTLGKAGVAGAVVGLGFAVKAGIGEFLDAQKVTAQTNAVLKSTGGVANVSREQIEKLSGSLLRKSGVDDEVIQSGANVLLTFTKVRNEVGRGNDIFNQATKATLDLSVALGKDMQSSSILVGKALNDPIKGMASLSRAGVQFTSEQKTTIKTLVATGDTLGAQKIILKELETQFGGSAEAAGKTFSGQMNIAKESALNFAGTMVEKSIPALTSLANFIADDVIPVLRRFYNWFNDNVVPVLGRFRDIAVNAWNAIAKVLKDNEPEINRITSALGTAMQAIGDVMLWLINKVWIPYLKVMLEKTLPIALGLAIDAFVLLLGAIDKVITVLKWIGENGAAAIQTFWGIVKVPLGKIKDGFQAVVDVIKKVIDGIKWLIEKIPDIPSLPDFGGGSGGGPGSSGGRYPGTGDTSLHGALPVMQPFADAAGGFGLRVTSGRNDHSKYTSSGRISDHFYGKALDVADGASSMAAFFKYLIGNPHVKQAFYDPLGSIFGGNLSSYREGGHSNHVHVATYDRGGWLMPGLTLARNNTGRPERVGPGGYAINVNVAGSVTSERDLVYAVRDGLNRVAAGNDGNGLTVTYIVDARPTLTFEVNFEDDPLQAHPAYLESISPAPLAFWRLGELTGTTATDEMGAFDGTYTGGVTLDADGAFADEWNDTNPAASFDGTDDYVATSTSATFQNLTADWTLGAWVYPTSTETADNPSGIVGVQRNAGAGSSPAFLAYGAYTSGTGMTGNKVWGGYWAGGAWGGEATVVSDPTAVTLNTWHHYVIAWNGSTLYLYRNGVEVDSNTTGSTPTAAGAAVPINIGRSPINTGWYFPGRIDEAFVFDYALDATQVAQLYRYHSIATPDEGNYVDLSDRLRPLSIRRGRSDPFSRVEAGNLTVPLDNQDGLLLPPPVVNLIANPSFEADEDYLPFTTSGHGSSLRVGNPANAHTGDWYLRLTGAATGSTAVLTTARDGLVGLRPGKTYTFSVYVYVPSGTGITLANITAHIGITTAGVTDEVPSSPPGSFDSWQRLTVTETIGTDAEASYVGLSFDHGSSAARAIRVDDAQLEEDDAASTYCDGDQTDCSWAGEPHMSMSRRRRSAEAPRKVVPMRRCRLTATWDGTDYGLFHGYVDRFAYTFPGLDTDSIVTLNVTDGTRILSNVSMRGFTRSVERPGDRVRAILDWAGISVDDYDVDDTYITAQALDSVTVADDTTALSMIRAVEETERGVFFVSRDGLFTYQGSEFRSIEGAEQFLLIEGDEGVPYSDIAAIIDLAGVVNDTKIENVAASTTHEFVEAYSQQQYLKLSSSESSLWDQDDVSYVYRGEPMPLADSVEVRPLRNPDTLWPIMLGLDLGALGRIERVRNGATDLFAGYLQFLEGIEHNVAPGNWTMNLRTSPTPVAPTSASLWQTPITKPLLKTSKYALSGGATVTMPSASYTAGRLYVVFLALFATGATPPSDPTVTSGNTWTNINASNTGTLGANAYRYKQMYTIATATVTETLQFNFAVTGPSAYYDIVVVEIEEGFNATPIGDTPGTQTGNQLSGQVDVGTLTDARSIVLLGLFKDAAATPTVSAVHLYNRAGAPTDSYHVVYGFPNIDTITVDWGGAANGWGGIAIEIEAT